MKKQSFELTQSDFDRFSIVSGICFTNPLDILNTFRHKLNDRFFDEHYGAIESFKLDESVLLYEKFGTEYDEILLTYRLTRYGVKYEAVLEKSEVKPLWGQN